MNRRQKIIVSVTGIFIVLLVLLGLTYAYFLTRITGNSNPTSISVTTANLELVYGDGTTAILTSETPLMPSSTPIGTKDFTVTNNGDDSEYVVVFEDVTVKYAADTVIDGEAVIAGTDTTFESNDFVYTLTCTVKDKNGNTLSDKSCDGVENEIFPMDGGIVVGNSIDKDDVHSYVLTMYYLDNGLDQSVDMNKTLNGKVNIKDIKSINPYSENKNSLAYNIINNSMLNKNGTELKATTDTKVAEEITWTKGTGKYEPVLVYRETWQLYDTLADAQTNGPYGGETKTICTEDMKDKYYYSDENGIEGPILGCKDGKLLLPQETYNYEQILSVTIDDYGTSYYYRGNVEDNYINFAGMCWRIVRIEGDGSIKLILEDNDQECNSIDTDGNLNMNGKWDDGHSYEFGRYSNGRLDFLNYEGGLADSFKTFQTSLSTKISEKYIDKTITDKLKVDEWCYDDKVTSTNSYEYDKDGDGTMEQCTDVYYGAHTRIITNKKPSLTCTGTKLTSFRDGTDMYVGTLTADEMSFAGAYGETNYNYYLVNNYTKEYAELIGFFSWYSLSPAVYYMGPDYIFGFVLNAGGGKLDYDFLNQGDQRYSRPAITLKTGTQISSGEGTQEKPYIVS